jgi:hypothetical protein
MWRPVLQSHIGGKAEGIFSVILALCMLIGITSGFAYAEGDAEYAMADAPQAFDHYPEKPGDLSDDFFNIAYQGCSESNISSGRSNVSNAILAGFIADTGSNNIERAGHRRWLLKPGAENFGIGYALNSGGQYGGHRINMRVFDGLSQFQCETDTYIAWPSSPD